jgi:hypothetical protein
MHKKGSGRRDSLYYRTGLEHVPYDCQDAEGGKIVLIQVGNFRCSAKRYCCRQGENSGLPTSPDEYRTKHALSGSLEFLRIPHEQNLRTAGAVSTSVSVGHSV